MTIDSITLSQPAGMPPSLTRYHCLGQATVGMGPVGNRRWAPELAAYWRHGHMYMGINQVIL
jgi:hypothetical protein